MDLFTFLLASILASLVGTQHIGTYETEIRPLLTWKNCTSAGVCAPVNGSLVLDANWRWTHENGAYRSCYDYNVWNYTLCPDNKRCTENCAVEGANYGRVYGINTTGDAVRMKFKTNVDFATNIGSRVYLAQGGAEGKTRYQMFRLFGNELAFDVDLGSVECGINSALYFVAMDEDGGVERYGAMNAGATLGLGYCDASCPRSLQFVGGQANSEGWAPSATDPRGGEGRRGACCPEISVWESNAHSFQTTAHVCEKNGYHTCEGDNCPGPYHDERWTPPCDVTGCDYNPYRMGNTAFYGRGKTVDTTKKFTVVTRFQEDGITRFFVQNGTKIEAPASTWPNMPKSASISSEYCDAKANALMATSSSERNMFKEIGGGEKLIETLKTPMALVMSILDDHWGHMLWLDSVWPPYEEQELGWRRGECAVESGEPWQVEAEFGNARVTWSDIRFGAIGTTV